MEKYLVHPGQSSYPKGSSSQQGVLGNRQAHGVATARDRDEASRGRRNGVVNRLSDRGRKARRHLARIWQYGSFPIVCCGGAISSTTGVSIDGELVEASMQDQASGWARDGPRRFGAIAVFYLDQVFKPVVQGRSTV